MVMAKAKQTEETEIVEKPKRKYHRVPKEYKELSDDIALKASPKMIEYIEVLKNILEDYDETIQVSKVHWESIKKIVLDVTEQIKDAENPFIRKDPDDVKNQKYHTKPTLLYMVHEKMRMNCVKDFLYNFEHADQEKDPEKYRLFYAWQIYGHLYFYLTERDKI